MSHLSVEAKEAIVLKAINRGSATIESIAQANNVGVSSLQKWLRRHREGKPLCVASKQGAVTAATRGEQFTHVVATHSLDEVSLGKYCREHGLYSHQLTQWRENFMKTPQVNPQPKQQAEVKKLKAENKALQRELRRKEKALAEASALLIMKKKADLIWGESEDD